MVERQYAAAIQFFLTYLYFTERNILETLVGSKALAHHIKINREPKDTDYFSDHPIEGAEVFYHPDLEKWPWGSIATLDELYTIKVSHSFWELRNGSWTKHMIHLTQMKDEGAQLIEPLFKLLYGIWEEVHGKKMVNLEKTPEEFFTSTVTRIYEHDSIHESVAFYDEPLFNAILRDDSEVAVSREKFNELSHEDKIKLVKEEVFATALERLIIPADYRYNQRQAYMWALRKLITSFSKGWFPLWVVENFTEFLHNDIDYVRLHLDNAHKLRKEDSHD